MPAVAQNDLADVAHASEPGSPEDLRRRAANLRESAAYHRDVAARHEQMAAELEAQAARDEQSPPDTSERLRRLLDGGLS